MKRTAYFSWGLMVLMLALASPAGAQAPIFVDDDNADCPQATFNTIQAAVNASPPGATILVCPGIYVNERVVLTGAKNGIQLIAVGRPGTVVLDGTDPSFGFTPNNHGFFLNGTSGVLIQGFALTRYFEEIRLTNANNNIIRRNMMTEAGHDGVTLVGSSGNLIEHNISFDNPSANACGINVVGASDNNVIRHNFLSNNNWGINIQNGPTGNIVFSNVAVNNRSHGILNRRASGTRIENNRVDGNGTGGVSTLFPGGPRAGIGIQSIVSGPPAIHGPSNNVTVARNRAFNNTVVDLFWDQQGAGNAFENNHCVTSDPDGLCAHTEGASQ